MAATSLGYFVVQLDVSIVNLSLPSIQRYFGVGTTTLQWVVNSYTVAFSVLLLSAGVLGDRFGSRNFLMVGYGTFFVGSAACGFSDAIPTLLAARFVQGIGAAMIVPNSLAIINRKFADQATLRVSLLGVWMAFGGAALSSGPIFGGLITSIASWRYIFLINLPVCLLGIVMTHRFIDADTPAINKKQDIAGQALIFVSAAALLISIINYRQLAAVAVALLILVSLSSFALFIRVEKASPHAAIPIDIFRNKGLQRALVYGIVVNFIYFGIVFFSSLYFRYALELDSLHSGLAFIPITLPLIVANIASGRLSKHYGVTAPINLGFLLLLAGILLLSVPALSHHYWSMLPAFTLISCGVGLITPMITSIAMLAVGASRGGMISAVVNFFRQIAGAFGVAVFGLFSADIPGASAYRHFGTALQIAAAICLASLLWFRFSMRAEPPDARPGM